MLRHELYRAFVNKKFYMAAIAGIIIAAAIFYIDCWQFIKTQNEINMGTEMGMLFKSKMDISITPQQAWMGLGGFATVNALYYIMPLLCAFVYATSYRNDIKSGYYNNILIRSSKSGYYWSKLLAVFLSGGVICTIPLVVNLLLCMMSFPMGPSVPGFTMFVIRKCHVFGDLFYDAPMVYILIYILFDFCFFGIINCICLSISCIEDNYFMVLIAPFMYYFALHAVNIWLLGSWEYSPQRYSQMKFLTYKVLPVMGVHIAVVLISLIPYVRRGVRDKDGWINL